MNKHKTSQCMSINIHEGGLMVSLSTHIAGTYTNLYVFEMYPTPGLGCLSPKDVEFVMSKAAEVITAIFKEESRQLNDHESSPRLMIDGSTLERMVAQAVLK